MTQRSTALLYFASGAAVCGICSVLFSLCKKGAVLRITPSPLATSAATDKSLPYPATDFIPGARDILTPLGSMRIYEFGPLEADRKVLLLHGASTPCVSLAGIADGLSKKGCRILMIDLFGRGWSDAPNSRYDETLYTTQIFMALASSSISWISNGKENGGFSIIGYSMGGGIAANFASFFPHLINDIVLLAPAGLLRPQTLTWRTRVLYSGILPNDFVANVVRNRLTPLSRVSDTVSEDSNCAEPSGDLVSTEVADICTTLHAFTHSIDTDAVVRWQMAAHSGFIPAFISSYIYAPIRDQHSHWRIIGQRLNAQRAAQSNIFPDSEISRHSLRAGKVLLVVGTMDDAINTPELLVDAKEVLGEENLVVLQIDTGHEVPITHPREIVEFIWEHWY